MRRTPAIMTLLLILYLLGLQGSLVQAGTVTLPGGWRADFLYCRNGYSAANIVIGSVASSTATNSIVVNSIAPSATGLGAIAIYSGTTIASGPGTFYWSLAQSPGTPVTASISRIENGVVVGTVTDTGTIQDCNVAIPPPAPDTGPDNRINPDPIAPVAIYCRPNGIEILTIDGQGNGHFAFLATRNQIDAVGIPTRNTLIAAGNGVGLFRLKRTFVPLTDAHADHDEVQVPFDRSRVRRAPGIEPDGELSRADEAKLYRHYGLDYGEPAGARLQRYVVQAR